MIIAQMNKYFSKHGRIIGIVIVIIISVTFVLFFGRMSVFDNFLGGGKGTVTLLNRKVDMSTRQEQGKRSLLWQSLHNPSIDLKNPQIQLGSARIVNSLLLTYAAEDMGIVVGDKAVDEYIKTVPSFQTGGTFDNKKYENYVKKKLKPAYYKVQDLKEAVREQLQHQSLRKTVIDSVVIPEEEIKEAFINDYTKVDAQLLKFDSQDYAKGIVMEDEEIENYFNSNKDKYRTEPSAKGKLVLFSYSAFRKEAEKQVKEEDLKKYYEENKFLYMKKADPIKKKLKKDPKPAKPEYEAFKDVRNKIWKEMVDKKVKSITSRKAQKFADDVAILTSDVFYDISDKVQAQKKCLEIFGTEAGKAKLSVKDSGWLFEGTTGVPAFGKEEKVVEAMTSLFDDNPVSEAIKGNKGVFVAILEAKRGPEARSFEKVKEQVKRDLAASKSMLLAREAARTVALDLSERLTKGEKIDAAAKALKLKLEKLPPVSTMVPLFMPDGRTVQKLVFATSQGKISKVENTGNGALLVYVEKKVLPTEEEYNKQKIRFSGTYKREKQYYAFQNYIAALMEASTTASDK